MKQDIGRDEGNDTKKKKNLGCDSNLGHFSNFVFAAYRPLSIRYDQAL